MSHPSGEEKCNIFRFVAWMNDFNCEQPWRKNQSCLFGSGGGFSSKE
jgi:hypothetical protein